MYRFGKRVKQSGILTETRKRRFRGRAVNRRKRRLSAQYRSVKRVETARQKKLGIL
jgi:ribosomal protein S21